MQQELSDRLGAYDNSISADLTKLKRWLNMGQQYICGKYLWSFMLAEEIVQTVTDISTGTVSVNATSTALTFSSAPTVSVANRYIQFSTTNDWYKITAHTASSTSATISPAYVDTSNLSGGTYIVRKLLYTTTTPLIQIIDMKQLVSPYQIFSIDPMQADFFLPLYLQTGFVHHYVMSSPDSTGSLQFSLINPPSSVTNIMVRGVQKLTDLSADADSSLVPVPWHDAILNIASFYGFQGLDDTRAATELQLGEVRIDDMRRNYIPDLGRHRIVQSVDESLGNPIKYYLNGNMGTWRV